MNLINFINKLITYFRNKIFCRYSLFLLKKRVSLKIENPKEFKEGLFEWGQKKYLLNFKDGFKLECEGVDLAAIGETCILEDYQRHKDIKIKEGDVVFDVGAHIGSFSVYAANKGARVFAFEPDVENLKN